MVNKKVSIIGLGLIGGSIAKALKERLGVKDITAVNRRYDPISAAIDDGIVSRGSTEINQDVFDSDIIIICTPVKQTMNYISTLSGKVKPTCIITDVSSTKSEIIDYINDMDNPPIFIGGHPMAGSEKTGYEASFSHLLENAYYVLSPSKATTEEALNLMTHMVKSLGAIPVVIEASEHDRVTSAISHVPHIIASVLVNLVKEIDSPDGKMHMLAAGGFKDITRIASSSPEMWENIIMSNSSQITMLIDEYIKLINEFKSRINCCDSDWIYNSFESAKNYRDTFSASKKGLLLPYNDLIVDVVDEPGIIGKIATLLGDNHVNIKNINVSNSREFEQGCLRITLSDPDSVNIAFDLLTTKGYKVYRCV